MNHASIDPPRIRDLGAEVDYADTLTAMSEFTARRTANEPGARKVPDEIWCLQHRSVYTLGQAGRREHVLNPAGIPLVQSDRGGQVTWHGPGQLVLYTLFDLRRLGIGVRTLVTRLEQVVIDELAAHGVGAEARRDAPGVYVDGAKIAALGLRVRHGCSYHGLSVNVDNALAPFAGINPCGYRGLEVTSFRALGLDTPLAVVRDALCERLVDAFDAGQTET